MKTDTSLYFHIPFCIKKCGYCAFYSVTANDEIKEAYAAAIIKQMEAYAAICPPEQISTVYLGGGTPPVIGIERIEKIIKNANLLFNIKAEAEKTIEVNPKSVTLDGLKRLKAFGFNRISIGLQTSNNGLLAEIGRVHTAMDFADTYYNARLAGFDNISVDLIFALPGQNIITDLDYVTSLSPEHISVYCLTLEKGTPLYLERGKYVFPSDDEQADIYIKICNYLRERGYLHYEISNFSVGNKYSRHNTLCWQRGEYIGFGVAAHSFYQKRRFYFTNDINSYIMKAETGFDLNEMFTASPLTTEEAEEERIMLGLRLANGIEYNGKIPQFLIDGEYIRRNGSIISLTDKGMFVSNQIISNILNNTGGAYNVT